MMPLRRLLLVWALLVAGVACLGEQPRAWWQSVSQISIGGVAAPTWTKTAGPAIYADPTFSSTTATFSSVAVNNASADTVVVSVSNSIRNITGVTIGGDAMTKAVESNAGGGAAASLWYRTGTAYTTPNIVVSAGAGLQFVGISVGKLTGVTATPTATQVLAYGYGGDPQVTASLTIPSTGFGIVVGGSETGANDPTWNAGTEDYDLVSGTDWRHTSGYFSATGTPSISGYPSVGFGIAAAAWGP